MLKYRTQVSKGAISKDEIQSNPSVISETRLNMTLSRSDSLTSISSLESNSDWSPLKIDISAVNQYSHYKTIRVSQTQDVSSVIIQLLSKLKLSNDIDYELWMEVKTRREGEIVVSSLKLDPHSKPLQLEKCLPNGMSRFILFPNLNVK